MTVAELQALELKEGQFVAELDEVYDEKKSTRTGKPFYMAGFRRDGVGTGDMFVSLDMWSALRKLTRGTPLLLTFTLSKREGMLSTYLSAATPL